MFTPVANLARLGLLALLILSGCASHRPAHTAKANADAVPATPSADSRIIGYSVEGRPIEAVTLGSGSRTILYIATIHGNESAGTPLLRGLEREIREHPSLIEGCLIVLVPVANPDGFAHKRRNNAHGVDLNRNFSAANFTDHWRHGEQPFSEPETRALAALIDEIRPTATISIHQPLSCIDYDGPAEALARAMSAAGNLPVKKLGAQPGSLGSYAGVERGIATITLELPGGLSRLSEDTLWQRYRTVLLAPSH